MAVNPNWPLTVTSFAPATDAFDPNAVPTWKDISNAVLKFEQAFGRQYELDQNEAGTASLDVWDPGEAFNPANGSSPYAGLDVYRRIIDQAMWPPAPVGGATNLLWGQGIDPSFESYTVGVSLSWVKTVGAGVAPTVTTTSPQQGTKCLTYATTAGGGENGIGLTVNCIPGQQYTASVYVQQTAANTVEVFINGDATGSSTTTTGAYVRLSVTWTATQPTHEVWVASFSTSLSGTVYVDAIQHEPGGTVSAFATTGPTIYDLFGGFVERYPRTWQDGGVAGRAALTCVDGLAVMARQFLQTEYSNAMLAKKPDYYWTLAEPSGATVFADTSGNNGPSLSPMSGKYGAGTVTAGVTANIVGDPNATAVTIDNGDGNTQAVNVPLTVLQYGVMQGTNVGITAAPSGAQSWSCTMALWMTHSTLPTANLFLMAFYDAVNGNTPLSMANSNTLGLYFGSGTVASASVADSWADGKPHLFVATQTMTSTGASQTVWVDGTQVANVSSAGDYRPKIPQVLKVMVGGFLNENTVETGVPATYGRLAYWNRALTSGEVADLWNAGEGYSGETSGARISRYLGYKWVGTTAIDTGQSTMGAATLAANTALVDACQTVASSENGDFYCDGNGTPTFLARTRRYLATSAAWVFGEQEFPYEEDMAYGFDNSQVYNDVRVTRSGGVTAVGGTAAAVQSSQHKYGEASYSRTVNLKSDLETQDAANWIFAGHANALQRIEALTVKPSSNPSLWPVALGAKKGDRVTVKRRTSTGLVMSADYFIERIERSRAVSDDAMEWTVSFQMSPTAVQKQPWIIGDSTYGVLDSTTVLAF